MAEQGADPNVVIEILARRIAQLEVSHAVEIAQLQARLTEATRPSREEQP
jgi:hypothetical protein